MKTNCYVTFTSSLIVLCLLFSGGCMRPKFVAAPAAAVVSDSSTDPSPSPATEVSTSPSPEVSATATNGTTIYVDALGSNTNDGSSALKAFKTITKALTVATAGNTISVAPGTYNAALGETFPLMVPEGVSLLGDPDTKGVTTLITGEGITSLLVSEFGGTFTIGGIVYFKGGDVSFKGFTVSSASRSFDFGTTQIMGAVTCYLCTSIAIESNKFSAIGPTISYADNGIPAVSVGGGIASIENNVFQNVFSAINIQPALEITATVFSNLFSGTFYGSTGLNFRGSDTAKLLVAQVGDGTDAHANTFTNFTNDSHRAISIAKALVRVNVDTNTFTGSGGIEVSSDITSQVHSLFSCPSCEIKNNHFTGSTYSSIRIADALFGSVKSNVIVSDTYSGIDVKNSSVALSLNSVSGNTAIGCGLVIDNTDATALTSSGDHYFGNLHGICLASSASLILTNGSEACDVTGNTTENVTLGEFTHINVSGCAQFTVNYGGNGTHTP